MLEVKFDDMLMAFEFASAGDHYDSCAYLDIETGEFIFVADGFENETPLPADLETSERYLAIPDKHELNLGRALVTTFVEQFIPDKIAVVSGYFRKRGAYARYKDLLEEHSLLDRWYIFEAEATKIALRNWCEDSAITLVESSP